MTVQFALESVSSLPWNHCPVCRGISDQFGVEYAKKPSLSIENKGDGMTLVHCFGGCSVPEIVAAVDMEVSDLFPPRDTHHGKPERRPFPAVDVLRCIAHEALVVAAGGVALLAGQPFTEEDRERLIVAVSRIQAALTAAGVRHE